MSNAVIFVLFYVLGNVLEVAHRLRTVFRNTQHLRLNKGSLFFFPVSLLSFSIVKADRLLKHLNICQSLFDVYLLNTNFLLFLRKHIFRIELITFYYFSIRISCIFLWIFTIWRYIRKLLYRIGEGCRRRSVCCATADSRFRLVNQFRFEICCLLDACRSWFCWGFVWGIWLTYFFGLSVYVFVLETVLFVEYFLSIFL